MSWVWRSAVILWRALAGAISLGVVAAIGLAVAFGATGAMEDNRILYFILIAIAGVLGAAITALAGAVELGRRTKAVCLGVSCGIAIAVGSALLFGNASLDYSERLWAADYFVPIGAVLGGLIGFAWKV